MSDSGSEDVLLERAIDGDNPALEQLLWQYYGTLERHIGHKIPPHARKHFGTEDILQVVFTNVFRDIANFKPCGPNTFYAWLRAIADHRLIDALRKVNHAGAQQVSVGAADSEQSIQNLITLVYCEGDSPSSLAASKEAVQAMQIALAGLPDDQREAVRLNYLEHRSIAEIAALLGRTEAAVRGLVHRGKTNLKEAMGRSSRWFTQA